MNSLIGLFVGMIIFMVIINLLPYLLPFFLIIWVVTMIFNVVRQVKMRKAQEQYYRNNQTQDDGTSYTNSESSNNSVNPDVIDVEYTEKEDN
ncbi:MAG: hypothetical protein RSC93_12530 [Erysipelotrichaceae bacterium]